MHDRLHGTGRTIATATAVAGMAEDAGQGVLITRMATLGALSPGLAHEFNTPIQYIGDNLKFLAESLRDITDAVENLLQDREATAVDADELKYLLTETPEAIRQSLIGVKRIADLAAAMRAFATEGGGVGDVDVNAAIALAGEITRNEWKYCADLELDLAADLPPAHGRAEEIAEAVGLVLLDAAAAIKAAASADRARITLSSRLEDDAVEIAATHPRPGDDAVDCRAAVRAIVGERHGGAVEYAIAGDDQVVRLRLACNATGTEQSP